MFANLRWNWKTTLAGFLAGAVPIIQGWLTGTLTLEKVLAGLTLVLLGALAKDGDKSGTAAVPVP